MPGAGTVVPSGAAGGAAVRFVVAGNLILGSLSLASLAYAAFGFLCVALVQIAHTI